MTRLFLIWALLTPPATPTYQELSPLDIWGFPGGASHKEPACQCRRYETPVLSLGMEDPLEEGRETHSSILAWRIPMERGGWQVAIHQIRSDQISRSVVSDSLRPRFNSWVGMIPWRRKWQPTPVFMPGESHGQWSLEGYRPWGFKGFPSGLLVKNPPAMQEPREMWHQSLVWEDPLEEGMATHSSIHFGRIPWTEDTGGLQSMGLHRVGHE